MHLRLGADVGVQLVDVRAQVQVQEQVRPAGTRRGRVADVSQAGRAARSQAKRRAAASRGRRGRRRSERSGSRARSRAPDFNELLISSVNYLLINWNPCDDPARRCVDQLYYLL